jgi:hypothetical protein
MRGLEIRLKTADTKPPHANRVKLHSSNFRVTRFPVINCMLNQIQSFAASRAYRYAVGPNTTYVKISTCQQDVFGTGL